MNRALAQPSFNLRVATTIVVGNMLGTGIFTSLGLQIAEINDPGAILLTWVLGGIMAMCGAVVYSKLVFAFPRSGGEYHLVGSIFGPSLGFSAGITSLMIGFGAPLALAAWAFGYYFQHLIPLSPVIIGSVLILFFSLIHLWNARFGGEIHFGLTIIKLLLFVLFILLILFYSPSSKLIQTSGSSLALHFTQPGFATALLYASFAYTGWNASCYIFQEVSLAQHNVRRSLLIGTVTIVALYILINYALLRAVPIHVFEGEIEVAFIAGSEVLGVRGGQLITIILGLAIMSSVSALIVTGSRVYQVMGEDYPFMKKMALKNSRDVPANAILIQSGLALILLFSSSFESILIYTGFTLALFSFLTVLGAVVLVYRNKDFSLSGLESAAVSFYLLLNIYLICFLFFSRTSACLLSVFLIALLFIIGKVINRNALS